MEGFIISGLKTTHRTYARTVAKANVKDGEDAPPEELQTLQGQVLKCFESKNMIIQSNNVAACHILHRQDGKSKPAIIILFVNQKYQSKSELLRQAKKLKGTGVYLNENLTKRNGDIARQARFLRKQNKIQAAWTRDCKVMIR